jgi:hypothetical protein
VAIHLCGLPGVGGRAGRPLLDLAPGGGCQPPGSLPTLVRSYRTVSPLPVRDTGSAARHRRSAFCCPEPTGHPVLAHTSTLALWSPDFPRRRRSGAAATRPTHRRPTTIPPPCAGTRRRRAVQASGLGVLSGSSLMPTTRRRRMLAPWKPVTTTAQPPAPHTGRGHGPRATRHRRRSHGPSASRSATPHLGHAWLSVRPGPAPLGSCPATLTPGFRTPARPRHPHGVRPS